MSKAVVPSVTTTICDHCGAMWTALPPLSGELHLSSKITAADGYTAGSSSDHDLCDTCLIALKRWLGWGAPKP